VHIKCCFLRFPGTRGVSSYNQCPIKWALDCWCENPKTAHLVACYCIRASILYPMIHMNWFLNAAHLLAVTSWDLSNWFAVARTLSRLRAVASWWSIVLLGASQSQVAVSALRCSDLRRRHWPRQHKALPIHAEYRIHLATNEANGSYQYRDLKSMGAFSSPAV
jgi:hypothetical protein